MKRDKDNPEWTAKMIKEARLMKDVLPEVVEAFKRGRPKSEKPKVHIGIRLDADIVKWLRKRKGYNALINAILRENMTP